MSRRRNQHRLALLALTTLVTLLLVSACGGASNPLVGKWEQVEEGYTVEFYDDGTLLVTTSFEPLAGNYKIIDDKHVEIHMVGGDAETGEYRVSGDRLILSDSSGYTEEFVRTK